MKLTIQTTPVAKGRPRFTKRGFAYTPPTTKKAEKIIKEKALKFYDNPTEKAIIVNIDFTFKPSKTRLKLIKGNYNEPMTIKPDIDNIAKQVLDALNGIAYKDDNQIVKMNLTKKYGQTDSIQIEVIECT